MNAPVITLHNISKIYKLYARKTDRLKETFHPLKKSYHHDFYAIKNMTLKVRQGEILGIVGMNGSGKSTLLKIISGILTPSSGQIQIHGRLVALLELGSGFNPEFTGLQNIYFYSAVMGFSKQKIDARLQAILNFAEIGEFIEQPLKTYSSGMRARLAFAVSVNINPEILILDEVLSVGDALFQRKCFAKMEEFFASGKTILYVSHSIPSVKSLCTRAIWLDQGELILEGSPKLVTAHYFKYLFAPADRKADLRAESQQLNHDTHQKDRFDTEKRQQTQAVAAPPSEQQTAYYIPNLVPKSTIITQNFDVEITQIAFQTVDGRQVNALVMNEDYIYTFHIRFGVVAEDVIIATAFKTVSGQAISWISTRYEPIKQAPAGANYRVECQFTCLMLPGMYYTNIGVHSLVNGEKIILSRIDDASAFQVQTIHALQYGGFVNCEQRFRVRQED